jgi:hypothetical protein
MSNINTSSYGNTRPVTPPSAQPGTRKTSTSDFPNTATGITSDVYVGKRREDASPPEAKKDYSLGAKIGTFFGGFVSPLTEGPVKALSSIGGTVALIGAVIALPAVAPLIIGASAAAIALQSGISQTKNFIGFVKGDQDMQMEAIRECGEALTPFGAVEGLARNVKKLFGG